MAQANKGLHESEASLDPGTLDRHRALLSLTEELEAVDWYDQRVAAASDDELRTILAHNRDEEKEHAAMVLEWLRRRDARLDQELRAALFRDGPIVDHTGTGAAADREGGGAEAGAADGSLGIGCLKGGSDDVVPAA